VGDSCPVGSLLRLVLSNLVLAWSCRLLGGVRCSGEVWPNCVLQALFCLYVHQGFNS